MTLTNGNVQFYNETCIWPERQCNIVHLSTALTYDAVICQNDVAVPSASEAVLDCLVDWRAPPSTGYYYAPIGWKLDTSSRKFQEPDTVSTIREELPNLQVVACVSDLRCKVYALNYATRRKDDSPADAWWGFLNRHSYQREIHTI